MPPNNKLATNIWTINTLLKKLFKIINKVINKQLTVTVTAITPIVLDSKNIFVILTDFRMASTSFAIFSTWLDFSSIKILLTKQLVTFLSPDFVTVPLRSFRFVSLTSYLCSFELIFVIFVFLYLWYFWIFLSGILLLEFTERPVSKLTINIF